MANTLKPSGLANVSVFNTHTVSSVRYLYPQNLSQTTAINTHAVTFGAAVLSPSIIGSTQLIHQASASTTYQLSASLYQSPNQIEQSILVATNQVSAPLYQSANQINTSEITAYNQLAAPNYQAINQIEQSILAAINQVTAPLYQAANQIDQSAVTTVNEVVVPQISNEQTFYTASSAFELLPETINTIVDFKQISLGTEYQLQSTNVQNVSEFSSVSCSTLTTVESLHYLSDAVFYASVVAKEVSLVADLIAFGNEFYTVGAEAINSVTSPIFSSSENISSIVFTLISAGQNLLIGDNLSQVIFQPCDMIRGMLADKFTNATTYTRNLIFGDQFDTISSNLSKLITINSQQLYVHTLSSGMDSKV